MATRPCLTAKRAVSSASTWSCRRRRARGSRWPVRRPSSSRSALWRRCVPGVAGTTRGAVRRPALRRASRSGAAPASPQLHLAADDPGRLVGFLGVSRRMAEVAGLAHSSRSCRRNCAGAAPAEGAARVWRRCRSHFGAGPRGQDDALDRRPTPDPGRVTGQYGGYVALPRPRHRCGCWPTMRLKRSPASRTLSTRSPCSVPDPAQLIAVTAAPPPASRSLPPLTNGAACIARSAPPKLFFSIVPHGPMVQQHYLRGRWCRPVRAQQPKLTRPDRLYDEQHLDRSHYHNPEIRSTPERKTLLVSA